MPSRLAGDPSPADDPLRIDREVDVGLDQPLAQGPDLVGELRPAGLDVEDQARARRSRPVEIDLDHLVVLAGAVEAVGPATGGGEDGDEVEGADHRALAERDVGLRLGGELAARADRRSAAEDRLAHLRSPVEGDQPLLVQRRREYRRRLHQAAAADRVGLGEEALGRPLELGAGRRLSGRREPWHGDRERCHERRDRLGPPPSHCWLNTLAAAPERRRACSPG